MPATRRMVHAPARAAVALTACLAVFAALAGGFAIARAEEDSARNEATELSEEELQEVERIFAGTCGWCHQAGGRREGRGPKLAGNPKTDQELFDTIHDGRRGMPAFGKTFDDDQIWNIVAYIRTLDEQ